MAKQCSQGRVIPAKRERESLYSGMVIPVPREGKFRAQREGESLYSGWGNPCTKVGGKSLHLARVIPAPREGESLHPGRGIPVPREGNPCTQEVRKFCVGGCLLMMTLTKGEDELES